MMPFYISMTITAFMIIFYACMLPYHFENKAYYELYQTIGASIIFAFWVLNLFLLVCMMHLLTDLMIFQSKVGVA